MVFLRSFSTICIFTEYLFVVGGSCFTKTEVVSLSQNKTEVPNCLSNLAEYANGINGIYYAAGGPLQYEGKETKAKKV